MPQPWMKSAHAAGDYNIYDNINVLSNVCSLDGPPAPLQEGLGWVCYPPPAHPGKLPRWEWVGWGTCP